MIALHLEFESIACLGSNVCMMRITHYGRNTHFRRICSSDHNFNFNYVYMKFEELRDNQRIFEEIMQKLASRENYTSEEIKFTIFL